MIARLLISLSIEIRKKEILETLTSHLGGVNVNHPDILYFASDSKLGIVEARKIKEHFSLKPYSAKGRAVVLENAGNLTDEGQNALLKTLEELPKHALFILGANSDATFLPTVLSRCEIVILGNKATPESGSWTSQDDKYTESIEKLTESSIAERFEFIEKLKDREAFFQSLVQHFHNNLASHLGEGGLNIEFLKKLLKAEQWQKQNVNLRAILEYLMLVMLKK